MQYNGKFSDNEAVNAILYKCTFLVHKKGVVRYQEFIDVKDKLALDSIKQQIKQDFANYE